MPSPNLTSAGGYVHYLYSNFINEEGTSLENYYNSKRKILINQIAQMTERRKQIKIASNVNKDQQTEVEDILEALENGFEEVFKELEELSIKPISGAMESGIKNGMDKNLTISEVACSHYFREAEEDKIVQDFNILISSVKNGLEEAAKLFGVDNLEGYYKLLLDNAIKQGGEFGGFSENKFRNEVLKKMKGKSGKRAEFLKISNPGNLPIALVRFYALVQALPSTGDYSQFSKSSSRKVMDILVGKISGGLGNVAGHGGEVAAKRCLDKANYQGMKTISTKIVGGSTTSVVFDDEWNNLMQELNISLNQTYRTVKPDIRYTVSKDDVIVEVDFSVKNYTFDKTLGTAIIDLHSNTPFLNLMYYGGLGDSQSLHYVFNIGGGRAGKGYSRENINKEWQKINELVGFSSLLFMLAGSGSLGDNALYLLVGSKVYSMEDILDYIQNSVQKGQNPLTTSPVSRYPMIIANAWINDERGANIKSTAKAIERTQLAKYSMASYLMSKKMDASLDLYGLMVARI